MRVFVSHGHDETAKLEMKAFLATEAGHTPVVLGDQPGRQGLTIIEALERFSSGCQFAVVLLTGDDVTSDGGRRARQNVIHEIGFFQGRLGRTRVVLLVQEGVEIPSNLGGLFYLKYRNSVRESDNSLREILASEDAGTSARQLGPEEWQDKRDKFDRYFPVVTEFLRKIVDFRLSASRLFSGAQVEPDSEKRLQAILKYGEAQDLLITSYLAARHYLDQDIRGRVAPAWESLTAASETRARARDRKWLNANMEQAMDDRRAYEEAFDGFVVTISEAFEAQAARLGI
jgi:hypothetical protein